MASTATRDSAPTQVSIDKVHASYDGQAVLHGLSMEAPPGELVALLGPSGCGKTTLLKVVAGLLAPDAGEVRFNGQPVTHLPPERRSAPMVFQQPLLFPHLTIARNIAFSLELTRVPEPERATRVAEALSLLKLNVLEGRYPGELSGGQEQRVSLARAMVSNPRLLLLDEPFSALDESLRAELRSLLKQAQQRLGITTLFVTHDQQEAATIASSIVLLLDGRVAQAGSPRDFYTRPATLSVARFFGWQCTRGRDGTWLAFRPESARLVYPEKHGTANSDPIPSGWQRIQATLSQTLDLGSHYIHRLRTEFGDEIEVHTTHPAPTTGQLTVALDPEKTVEFPGAH
jgi:ABC-type Fe3+/spermidine/putrescine transport system ATPase subunit